MKQLILIAMMTGFVAAAQAQDIQQSEVPSLVLNAFQSKFSNATDVEWEREADLFKVEFEIGNKDHDLWIEKNGNIKKHKEEITSGDLPKAIAGKLKSDFQDYRVDDVEKIEVDNKVFFQVDLDGRAGDREVVFQADGTIADGLPNG